MRKILNYKIVIQQNKLINVLLNVTCIGYSYVHKIVFKKYFLKKKSFIFKSDCVDLFLSFRRLYKISKIHDIFTKIFEYFLL